MSTSYIGCHECIKESLKKGQHIQANIMVGSHDVGRDTIMAYVAGDTFPYHGYLGNYVSVTPSPKAEIRIVGQVKMMAELEARGFTMATVRSWESAKDPIILCSNIFFHCGKVPAVNAKWPRWLLETVEVSPNTKDSDDIFKETFSNMIDGD